MSLNLPDELVLSIFRYLYPIEVLFLRRTKKQWFRVEKLFWKKFEQKIKKNFPTLYIENLNWKNEIILKYKKNLKNPDLLYFKPPHDSKIFFNLDIYYETENEIEDELKNTCIIKHNKDTYIFSPDIDSEKTKETKEIVNKLILTELKLMNSCNLLSKNILLEIIVLLDGLRESKINIQIPHAEPLEKKDIKQIFKVPTVTCPLKKCEFEEAIKNIDVKRIKNEYVGCCFSGEKRLVFGGFYFVYRKVYLSLQQNDWNISSLEIWKYSIIRHSK
eukprot:gene11085-3791_t